LALTESFQSASLELCVRTGRLILGTMGSWLALCCLVSRTIAQSVQGSGFDPTPVSLSSSGVQDSRPLTSTDLLTLRDPKGLSISPDGKYVAFIVGQAVHETNSYRSGLFVVATEGNGRVRSFGTAGMPHWDEINQWIPEAPQWSSNSNEIWYRARMQAGEHWQVWGWKLQSGRRHQITDVAADVEGYRYIAEKCALFLTVVKAPAEKRKRSVAGILFTGQIRPYQSIPVLEQLERTREPRREYWIHEFRTGRERLATPREIRDWEPTGSSVINGLTAEEREALAKYHLVERKEDPIEENVAYVYQVDDPFISPTWSRRLLLWSRNKRMVKEVTPDAYFVEVLGWSSNGAEFYFTERDGRGHSPELWKVSGDGSNAELVFKSPEGGYVSSFVSDRSGRYFACLTENNISPPKIALLDAAKQQVRTLAELNPDFDRLQRSPADRVEGTNRYGDKWFGYLVKPPDYKLGNRYPLIVTTYRSGDYFLRGASGDENPIQVYAARGFVVLSFDVGPTRNLRPGHFEEKVQDWASPTASLEDAVHQLSDQGLIDPEGVGIAGFSHGEEIAGYAVAHTNLFRAAIGAAFYDPCFYFLGGSEWWSVFERWGLGGWPERKSKSNWQQLALSMNADRIRTPILENASDTEYLIYLPVYRSLSDLGKPVELRIYPNELHVRNQPRHRLEIYERNSDWFLFWLKGKERADPQKSEQYRSWRQMRSTFQPYQERRP
jgi:dipeptidyl aminopeptidase/acylaminoacyl peptidase